MKLVLLTCIIIVFALNSLFGQCECNKLLEDGLYSFTSMTKTGSFSQDMRTYFLSKEFKNDLRNGKWGSSVTVPINNIPVMIGANYNDEEILKFSNEILSKINFSINESIYETIFSSIPNVKLYESYIECQKICNDKTITGFIKGSNVETEELVIFNFYYRPQAVGDQPTVNKFDVFPAGSLLNEGFIKGQKLNTYSFQIACKRDLEKDIILTLETDRGVIIMKSVAEGAFSSGITIPIGTIVTSALNFEQFSFTTKNNEKSPGGIWTSSKSKWAPCDGRQVPESKYSKIVSNNFVPDLRGVFLRGLNNFDSKYFIPPKNNNQLNPDNSIPLSYQDDALQTHVHEIRGPGLNDGGALYGFGSGISVTSSPTNAKTSSETRPKNVSVYYYIKIN